MGRTDNQPNTYPRLGDLVGFIPRDRLVETTHAVMSVQRDYGDRVERARARFKYTIDDKGLAFNKSEIEARMGVAFEAARHFACTSKVDPLGWRANGAGHFA